VTVGATGPEPVPLPGWCTLVRAANPGPMTLEGTNTYVLRGDGGGGVGGVVVVDPGPLDEDHLLAVAGVAGQGAVALTLLTHGHPDHAEGARRFHELTGAPVRALDPAHCVGTDEPLGAGPVGAGPDGLAVDVLLTPGHTADSVCFVVEGAGTRAVLTGDTVLGRGTTVVAHPDGSLAPYLDSLRRIVALGPVTLLPGHGPMRPDAAALAREYLEHREARLAQVRRAVADGATTAPEVVRVVYADVDEALWPAAELSVRAQLDYLAGRS
jgi:glyoxylase-like metal-dependent hydrolase (beta-lactamase superfamily II)